MEKFSLFDNPKNYSRDADRLNKMLEILWWIDPSLNPACGKAEPAPKYAGMIAYADGVNWNPGAGGQGIYWYDGAAWNHLATGGGGSYIPTSEKAAANGVASLDINTKVVQEPASKGAASGIASLDINSKVVQDPANSTATPTASKIPISDVSGKLSAWVDHTGIANIGTNAHSVIDAFIASKAAASGLASLNASSKVVQDPASASKQPAAGNIVMINDSTLLDLHSSYVGLQLYTPNSYAGTSGPDSYTAGRYNVLVEFDGSWPVNYGFVFGYRHNVANHYQIFVAKEANARMWIRYTHGDGTWDAWKRILGEDLLAAASGIATLDSSSKVVQDPANATATATASKIPIADGSGKLDSWISAKPLIKDWGSKGASFTLDLSLGDEHIVSCTAAITITISSSFTNDKALVVIKNGGNIITLAGIDTDPPTLTNAVSKQDFMALVKSFGKITCVSSVLNKAAV